MNENIVTIADYGLGNLFSLTRAVRHLGFGVESAKTAEDVLRAERLILPGVGAFGDGMRRLEESGMADAVREFARARRPLLGICLGMQLLFSESEEFGLHRGLGLIPGRVRRFSGEAFESGRIKVPNIGWRALRFGPAAKQSAMLEGVREGESVYFVHSFCAFPENGDHLAASAEYGGFPYSAIVLKDSVTGCQFHPEKSGRTGLAMLRSFCSHGASKLSGAIR